MFLQIMLFVLLFANTVVAKLPDCPANVICPEGGIWSEWSTTDTCATNCGSCSKMYYTRTCLSERSKCNCTGETSRYVPCNTQQCKYPSQRSCCIPYVSMVINRTSQCGPLPKDPLPTANSQCCPKGGMWSEWSGFSQDKNTMEWIQSRECTSEEAGCPCAGSPKKSQTECPCPPMKTGEQVAAACAGTRLWWNNDAITDDSKCRRIATLIANNDDFRACFGIPNYTFTSLVTFSTPTNTCPEDHPWDCEARREYGNSQKTLNITFSCNLEELQWMYDYDNTFVNGYVQIYQLKNL